MSFLFWLCLILFIFVCLFMILLVLIQKGRGGGLASAFGGAGGNTAFGSKTGDVLTWATSLVFGIFLVLSVTLNLLAKNQTDATTPLPGAPAGQQQTGGGNPTGSGQVPDATGLPPAIDPNRDLPEAGGGTAPNQPTNVSSPAPTTQPK